MKRIHINGFLDDVLAERVIDEIRSAARQPIDLRINSEGGLFAVAILILLEVEEHRHAVYTTVVGRAGSGAAVIALGGDARRIDRRGEMMLHYARPGDYESGREMRELIHEYTKQHPGNIADWLFRERVFDSDEACRAGLVDRVIDASAPDAVWLKAPPKRRPAVWLRSYREFFERCDLRPAAAHAHGD